MKSALRMTGFGLPALGRVFVFIYIPASFLQFAGAPNLNHQPSPEGRGCRPPAPSPAGGRRVRGRFDRTRRQPTTGMAAGQEIPHPARCRWCDAPSALGPSPGWHRTVDHKGRPNACSFVFINIPASFLRFVRAPNLNHLPSPKGRGCRPPAPSPASGRRAFARRRVTHHQHTQRATARRRVRGRFGPKRGEAAPVLWRWPAQGTPHPSRGGW
jgi:hypothetical protein